MRNAWVAITTGVTAASSLSRHSLTTMSSQQSISPSKRCSTHAYRLDMTHYMRNMVSMHHSIKKASHLSSTTERLAMCWTTDWIYIGWQWRYRPDPDRVVGSSSRNAPGLNTYRDRVRDQGQLEGTGCAGGNLCSVPIHGQPEPNVCVGTWIQSEGRQHALHVVPSEWIDSHLPE